MEWNKLMCTRKSCREYVDEQITTAQLNAGQLVVDWSGYNSAANNLQLDMTNSYFIDTSTGLLAHNHDGVSANNGSYLYTVKNTQVINADGSISVMFFKADPSQNYSLGSETEPVSAQENNGVYTVYIPKQN